MSSSLIPLLVIFQQMGNDDLSDITYINVNNNRQHFYLTSNSIVLPHLCKLPTSNATGLDNNSTKITHEYADLISVSICDLFNMSLVSGIFPDAWKYARVTPLFKQGDSSIVNNYLPVSVVLVIAKVFERIVYDQLYNFLIIGDITSKQQSEFCSLH